MSTAAQRRVTIPREDLVLIKKVVGPTDRADYLFLFTAPDGKTAYVASCIHGGRSGKLFLEGRKWETLKVEKLRGAVCSFFDYEIPPGAYLYITPCYPGSINRHRGEALAKRGVRVIGNWFRPTYFHVEESPEGWIMNCHT
jgi:hypothetical protein